jgi:hypothetical protein
VPESSPSEITRDERVAPPLPVVGPDSDQARRATSDESAVAEGDSRAEPSGAKPEPSAASLLVITVEDGTSMAVAAEGSETPAERPPFASGEATPSVEARDVETPGDERPTVASPIAAGDGEPATGGVPTLAEVAASTTSASAPVAQNGPGSPTPIEPVAALSNGVLVEPPPGPAQPTAGDLVLGMASASPVVVAGDAASSAVGEVAEPRGENAAFAAPAGAAAAPIAALPEAHPLCESIGPFSDRAAASRAQHAMVAPLRAATLREERVTRAVRHWVLAPVQPSKEAAAEYLASLGQAGVKDAWRIPSGPLAGRLAVGVFQSAGNARKHADMLARKGVAAEVHAPKEVEQSRVYWVDYERPADAPPPDAGAGRGKPARQIVARSCGRVAGSGALP